MKLLVLKKITSRASIIEKKPEPNNKKVMLILTKSSEPLERESLKGLELQIYLQKYLVVVKKKSGARHQSSPLSFLMYFIIQSFYKTLSSQSHVFW